MGRRVVKARQTFKVCFCFALFFLNPALLDNSICFISPVVDNDEESHFQDIGRGMLQQKIRPIVLGTLI